MKLFLRILLFIFTLFVITVGKIKSATAVNILQKETSYSVLQEPQLTINFFENHLENFYKSGDHIVIYGRQVSFRYNRLGQLLTKNTAGLELATYQYNIQGWLTGQRLSETLSYSGQYGGNIASMSWNANNRGNQSYTFAYDQLGRMKQASYTGTGGRNYSETLTYDKHGNPLSISRYGRIQSGASFTYGLIDNLSMPASSYSGNQLISISESVTNQLNSDLMEFKKSNISSPHYAYDANGNLTKDSHKNVSGIQYNFLNLPKLVTFGDGKTITYTHDASGVKHEVTYYNPTLNPATSKTNYVSNKIYENGNLSMVLTEEGYLKKQGSTYVPFYYLKDHLGSNRIVMEGTSGGVVQITDHYPFGMSFADNPPRDDQSVQRYKYTGKELDREHGLNLYDYGARMYDPAIGRFTTMDPLAEKYYSISPYAYCNNNPIKYTDPDGRDVIALNNAAQQAILNTLPKDIRGSVVFNQNGNINKSSFNSISSTSGNFAALSQLVNDNKIFEVNVADKITYKNENGQIIELSMGEISLSDDKNGSFGFNTGEEGWQGVTQTPGNAPEKYNSPDGNVKIVVNSGLSMEGQAQIFAHEGYGHAYLYSKGKEHRHQVKSTPEGFRETNKALGEAIYRAIEETIKNMGGKD